MSEVTSSAGTRIHYDSFGRGAAVILLHPANATRRSWADLGWVHPITSAGHRAVALDSRGFGTSDRVSSLDQLDPRSSSSDIIAVMEALEIDAAHLCGYSLGAAQALRFALDHPQRVRSLVIGGLGVGPLGQMGLHLSRDAEVARTEALLQVKRLLEKASGAPRAYFLLVEQLLSDVPIEAVTPSGIRAPILGLSGDRDRFTPLRLYERLRQGGAEISISTIPGTGHGSGFTHPEFRRRALDFVAQQAGRPTRRCS